MNEFDRFTEKLTTIFLMNAKRTHLMLLKRSASKKFAPGLYTGTGGKFEPGENAQQCAERELFEETGIKTPLTEFARLIFNKDQRILSQFFGIYGNEILPQCPEGTLEWVELNRINYLGSIPTAKIFLNQWAARNWDIKKPFTIFIERENLQDLNGAILFQQIAEGLHFNWPAPQNT